MPQAMTELSEMITLSFDLTSSSANALRLPCLWYQWRIHGILTSSVSENASLMTSQLSSIRITIQSNPHLEYGLVFTLTPKMALMLSKSPRSSSSPDWVYSFWFHEFSLMLHYFVRRTFEFILEIFDVDFFFVIFGNFCVLMLFHY